MQHESISLGILQLKILQERAPGFFCLLEGPLAFDFDISTDGKPLGQVIVHIVAFTKVKIFKGQAVLLCFLFRGSGSCFC